MGRYSGKTCRLLSMLVLTATFFLVELIVGYITNSLALVGDSYHMLSDVVALVVGFASVRISKWNTQKNTFGWARAEVLGALVNAVFLCALCFTIFVEAIQRMFGDEHINDPNLMLVVGGVGLVINLIGLALFHGHSHGGHGHSHGGGGGHGHSHGDKEKKKLKKQKKKDKVTDLTEDRPASVQGGLGLVNEMTAPSQQNEVENVDENGPELEAQIASSAQLNMKGVFLHILGDALGSVIVIISALCIKFIDQNWKYKIDPAMSMLLVVIILSTSIPLLRESAFILLQTVPTHIHIKNLQDKLLEQVEGVLAIHEFHVWQLAGNRIIASAHICCRNLTDYMKIAEDVKNFFHQEGIHSTTIQPEFVEQEDKPSLEYCLNECPESCNEKKCCRKRLGKEGQSQADIIQQEDDISRGQTVELTCVQVDVNKGECHVPERTDPPPPDAPSTGGSAVLTRWRRISE